MIRKFVFPHKKIIIVLSLAIVGSFLGVYFQLPLGALIGSFILIAIAQIAGLGAKPLKKRTRQVVQMVIGGTVGMNMSHELLDEVVYLIFPGILLAILHIMTGLFLAMIISKFFKVDIITALCGTMPAGLSEVAVIAKEHDADIEYVVLMHLFRVTAVVILIPILVHFL
ncbi:membrane AbrB-like protein [Bacillus oleivorans]|uniref:Membrane AbrB-like protein n=1 Tax=Bacillus oleivorans TaxID=1448271 RepID=A0A285D6S7_9BACI|nr:AbrB family transcriptional regulator [Bacillus oleivorans]SNX75517.1 membrane AbrB-like protein [Bacillus oleivorans]